MNFPVPVCLKRLAAAFLVFIFDMFVPSSCEFSLQSASSQICKHQQIGQWHRKIKCRSIRDGTAASYS
jgi:hypothetical protein